jgi:hypothetical protein
VVNGTLHFVPPSSNVEPMLTCLTKLWVGEVGIINADRTISSAFSNRNPDYGSYGGFALSNLCGSITPGPCTNSPYGSLINPKVNGQPSRTGFAGGIAYLQADTIVLLGRVSADGGDGASAGSVCFGVSKERDRGS